MKQFIENGYWLALVSLLGFISIVTMGMLRLPVSDGVIATTCISGLGFCVVTVIRIITRC